MIPAKIRLLGDELLAQEFIGPAMSQLNILMNQMKFQKLKQGVRRIRLSDNIYVECLMIYGSPMISIFAEAVEEVIDLQADIIESDLFVVYGLSEILLNLRNVTEAFISGDTLGCSGCECAGEITAVGTLDVDRQTVYGDFTTCDYQDIVTTGSAFGTVFGQNWYFENTYKLSLIDNNTMLSGTEPSNNRVASALDFLDDSFFDLGDYNRKEWSKTCKTFMVSAFSNEPKDLTGVYRPYDQYTDITYSFYASFNGQQVTWEGSDYLGPYTRYKVVQDFDYEDDQLYRLHIGFDIWQDDNEDYYVGIMHDGTAKLTIYKLDVETNILEQQISYTSTVRTDYYTYLDETYSIFEQGKLRYLYQEQNLFVRVIGYGYRKETDEHIVYWAELPRTCASPYDDTLPEHYPYPATNFYCSEVLNTGVSEKHFVETKYPSWTYEDSVLRESRAELLSTFWNPLEREIKFIYNDKTEDYNQTYVTEIHEPLILPNPGFPSAEYEYGSITTITTTNDFGDFHIGDHSFSQGGWTSVTIEYAAFYFGGWHNLRTETEFTSRGYSEYSVVKYGMNFQDSSLAANYQKRIYSNEGTWGAWYDFSLGYSTWLAFAHDFDVHDDLDSWTAVLISGIDKQERLHEDWVIYKDLIDAGNYLVVTNNGAQYNLSDQDRAFFFQYYNEDIIDI